nr:MAG: RNA-dependent RNA polymerase [Longquan rodent ribovirus 1]
MDILDRAGIGSSELKAHMNRIFADPRATAGVADWVSNVAVAHLQSQQAANRETRVLKIAISEKLTSDQEQLLLQAYPEFDIHFKGATNKAHSLAAACRKLEYALCLYKTGYSEDTADCLDGHDDYICDIGGDFAKHVMDENYHVHSCCPRLDSRDNQRIVTRIEALKRCRDKIAANTVQMSVPKFRKKISRINSLLSILSKQLVDTDIVCFRKAQDCPRTARYGIMIHSVYDVTLRQLANMMTRKNMSELYGTFIFDPVIYMKAEGVIEGVNAHFKYVDGGRRIRFSFVDDPSLTYVHDISVYQAYTIQNTFFDSLGQFSYVLELLDNRIGVQFFRVTRLPADSKNFPSLVHYLWTGDLSKYTKVIGFDLDWDAIATRNLAQALRKREVYVETETVERLREHAYAVTEAKFKPVELLQFLLAFNSRIHFGSDVVVRKKRIDFDDAVALAYAVYVETYIKKYDQGKILQKLLDDIAYDRRLAVKSLLGKFFSSSRGHNMTIEDSTVEFSSFGSVFAPFHKYLWENKRSATSTLRFLASNVRYIDCAKNESSVVAAVRHRVARFIPKFARKVMSENDFYIAVPEFFRSSLPFDITTVVERYLVQTYGSTICGRPDVRVLDSPTVRNLAIEISANCDSATERDLEADGEYTATVSKFVIADVVTPTLLTKKLDQLMRTKEKVRSLMTMESYGEFVAKYKPDVPKDENFVSRAEYKLRDIFNSTGLHAVSFRRAIDLCAAPGGFTKALLDYVKERVFVHRYTLAPSDCVMNWEILSKVDVTGKICDITGVMRSGDLTDPVYMKQFAVTLEAIGKVDLVVADGAIHSDEDRKYRINADLVAAESTVALSALDIGGTFIMKIFSASDSVTANLVVNTASFFEKWLLVKPKYSSPYSEEMYACFTGFLNQKHVYRPPEHDLDVVVKRSDDILEQILMFYRSKTPGCSLVTFDTKEKDAFVGCDAVSTDSVVSEVTDTTTVPSSESDRVEEHHDDVSVKTNVTVGTLEADKSLGSSDKTSGYSSGDVRSADSVEKPSVDVYTASSPYDLSTLIDVPGDGECLFYAVMGGAENDTILCRCRLRDYLLAEEHDGIDKDLCFGELRVGQWAGFETLKLFSKYYRAHVSVYMSKTGEVLEIKTFTGSATFRMMVHYDGSHYCILPTCSEKFPVSSARSFITTHRPVNVDCIYQQLNGMFQESIRSQVSPVKYWTKIFFGKKSTSINVLTDFNNVENWHTFYNAAARRCYVHNDCANGGFSLLVDKLYHNGFNKTLFVLFDRINIDFIALDKVVEKYNLPFTVFNLPGVYDKGYVLVAFAVRSTFKNPVRLSEGIAAVGVHVLGCDYCRSEDVCKSPTLNMYTNVFSFCSKIRDTAVYYTDQLDNCVIKIRLVEKPTYAGMMIVRKGDYLCVPVVLDQSGNVSTRDEHVLDLSSMLDSYFRNRGMHESIGLVPGDVKDLLPVTRVLDRYCYAICIQGSRTSDTSMVSSDAAIFSPKYIAVATVTDRMRNAMLEAIEIWRVSTAAALSSVAPSYNKIMLLMQKNGNALPKELVQTNPDFGLINLATGKYLIKPKVPYDTYQCAFDGRTLLSMARYYNTDGKLVPVKGGGIVAVSAATRLMIAPMLYDKVKDLDVEHVPLNFDLELVEGVPGCGKTTYIINNHDPYAVNRPLVLTATRESARDIRERVLREYPDLKDVKQYYRTGDSYLLAYSATDVHAVDHLWIDEALMRHPGEIFLYAVLSGAKHVHIFGDRQQIPFVNRNATYRLLYDKLVEYTEVMSRKFLSTSYRCPLDVVAYLNSLNAYSDTMYGTSSVKRSVVTRHIPSLPAIMCEIRDDWQVLTFTQAEKAVVLDKYPRFRVNTVHEFQGKQTEKVLVLRLNDKPIDIYKSRSHQLVALSRHTKEFIYATVVQDDYFKFLGQCKPTERAIERARQSMRGGGRMLATMGCRQYPEYSVDVRPELVFDKLTTNKALREFVEAHGSYNVVPLSVDIREVDTYIPDVCMIDNRVDVDPLLCLQESYDQIFPGASVVDTSYDVELFEAEPFVCGKEKITIVPTFRTLVPKYDKLKPVMRTACPRPVVDTQKILLKAFFDRNGLVPELSGETDDWRLAKRMMDSFVTTYIDDVSLFNSYEEHLVDVNVDSLENWFFTQPQETLESVVADPDYSIFTKELNKYSFILKRLPKPKLECGAQFKFLSPQTIAHHCKKINAVFCPIVRDIKKRLLAVLRRDKVIFCDMSVDDLENILSYRLTRERLRMFKHMLEVDFSKYDKSQNRVSLLFELLIMQKLGVPEEYLSMWVVLHTATKLYNPALKFKADVFYQRKSGDAMTFFGNTLVLMAVLADSMPLRDSFCLFSGDDSLIFSNIRPDAYELAQGMALRYNFEAKLLKFSCPYFCSKFMIMLPNGRWVIVPDLAKVLTKLGRHDMVNFDHVEMYRISLADNLKHCFNRYIVDFYAQAFYNRYPWAGVIDFVGLFSALSVLVYDSNQFASLYYIADGSVIDENRYALTLNEF